MSSILQWSKNKKLLSTPNLDTLQKLIGHWKTIVAMSNFDVGKCFCTKNTIHNKRIYIGRGNELINLEFMKALKKKLIQFANIFHLLRVG